MNEWINKVSNEGDDYNYFEIIESDLPNMLAILDIIGNWTKSIWSQPLLHPHYTDHSLKHSYRIGQQLNRWLNERRAEKLKPLEAFILLGAIYLHDIGMQCTDSSLLEENVKIPESDDLRSPNEAEIKQVEGKILEGIRASHHKLSEKMIENYSDNLTNGSTEYMDIIKAIALVSESHGEKFPKAVPKTQKIENEEINLRRVAYLLRIGDCLDATKERIQIDHLTEDLKSMNDVSKMHYAKHWIIEKVEIGNFFNFVYSIPKEWKEMGEYLVTIAMDTLKKDIERYNTLLNLHSTHLCPEGPPEHHLSENENKLPCSWELDKEEVAKEATKCHMVDAVWCVKNADEEVLIAGQNLHSLAHPERDLLDFDENYFKKEFFKQMKNRKTIKLLILNPKNKSDVDSWDKKLRDKNDDLAKLGFTFKTDLAKSIRTFKVWIKEAKETGYGKYLEIKCGDMVYDSVNIIDPDTADSMIYYTRTVQVASRDPLDRKWDVLRYGDQGFDSKVKLYEEVFSKAIPIEEITEQDLINM